MNLVDRCRHCGVDVTYKRCWFSPLSVVKTVECHPCHMAKHPTVEYLLDALAIAQWEEEVAAGYVRYDHQGLREWTAEDHKHDATDRRFDYEVLEERAGAREEP